MQHSTHSVDVNPLTPKEQLLEILKEKSVCRGAFTLASGAQSDFYVDAKLTTSDPRAALLVGSVGWELVKETTRAGIIHVDSIGGLTMGADWMALSIGIAAHLEDLQAALRVFSVRKSAKEHGRLKRIEGNFSPGDSVVVVDDVITTGGSTIQAIDAIEEAGGRIAFVIALVDRQEGGRENIEKRGHKVVPIFTRAELTGADARQRSHIGIA
ncbi:MAG: orotate phosphoribosyltransferase [Verrucomicrobia bacterium]|nr:MAG: orotate phosphoribosyltransferase [Verrucomicrobiota bacterium]PYK52266.1 MAG: orotate phosphoribosyltransferase [Verrucomicrobiota bacterium]